MSKITIECKSTSDSSVYNNPYAALTVLKANNTFSQFSMIHFPSFTLSVNDCRSSKHTVNLDFMESGQQIPIIDVTADRVIGWLVFIKNRPVSISSNIYDAYFVVLNTYRDLDAKDLSLDITYNNVFTFQYNGLWNSYQIGDKLRWTNPITQEEENIMVRNKSRAYNIASGLGVDHKERLFLIVNEKEEVFSITDEMFLSTKPTKPNHQ